MKFNYNMRIETLNLYNFDVMFYMKYFMYKSLPNKIFFFSKLENASNLVTVGLWNLEKCSHIDSFI